ncbi:YcxB family protein [[Eubacterium] tenue]|nr:YcxB family protein [[Eubacterium] tenue]
MLHLRIKKIKLDYTQIYKVFESKNYFINYFNVNQATFIRKKDMESEVIDRIRSLYKKSLIDKYKKVNR